MTATHKHAAPDTEGATITWWARFYHPLVWLVSLGTISKIRKATIQAARLLPGEAVLDVGCGTGDLTLRAARRVGPEGRTVGIDASPQMIGVARDQARKKRREIDFQVAPIEALPFGDAEFDAALSSLMLHHLPGDLKQRGLAEVRRVLKPGGRLLAVDIAPGTGLISRFMGLLGHSIPSGYADELAAAMREAGFTDVERLDTGISTALFLRATV